MVSVDPKSVERWIAHDKVPRSITRRAICDRLGVEETYLWPSLLESSEARAASMGEIVEVWPTRGTMPGEAWTDKLAGVQRQMDLLAFAGTFLIDSFRLLESIRERAAAGVGIRLLVGDPASFAVAQRGRDERKDSLPHRCAATIEYLREVSEVPGLEVRTHQTTLYASIYRFDDAMYVNPHSFGLWAAESPVLHLRKLSPANLFTYYAAAYERVWETGAPVTW